MKILNASGFAELLEQNCRLATLVGRRTSNVETLAVTFVSQKHSNGIASLQLDVRRVDDLVHVELRRITSRTVFEKSGQLENLTAMTETLLTLETAAP